MRRPCRAIAAVTLLLVGGCLDFSRLVLPDGGSDVDGGDDGGLPVEEDAGPSPFDWQCVSEPCVATLGQPGVAALAHVDDEARLYALWDDGRLLRSDVVVDGGVGPFAPYAECPLYDFTSLTRGSDEGSFVVAGDGKLCAVVPASATAATCACEERGSPRRFAALFVGDGALLTLEDDGPDAGSAEVFLRVRASFGQAPPISEQGYAVPLPYGGDLFPAAPPAAQGAGTPWAAVALFEDGSFAHVSHDGATTSFTPLDTTLLEDSDTHSGVTGPATSPPTPIVVTKGLPLIVREGTVDEGGARSLGSPLALPAPIPDEVVTDGLLSAGGRMALAGAFGLVLYRPSSSAALTFVPPVEAGAVRAGAPRAFLHGSDGALWAAGDSGTVLFWTPSDARAARRPSAYYVDNQGAFFLHLVEVGPGRVLAGGVGGALDVRYTGSEQLEVVPFAQSEEVGALAVLDAGGQTFAVKADLSQSLALYRLYEGGPTLVDASFGGATLDEVDGSWVKAAADPFAAEGSATLFFAALVADPGDGPDTYQLERCTVDGSGATPVLAGCSGPSAATAIPALDVGHGLQVLERAVIVTTTGGLAAWPLDDGRELEVPVVIPAPSHAFGGTMDQGGYAVETGDGCLLVVDPSSPAVITADLDDGVAVVTHQSTADVQHTSLTRLESGGYLAGAQGGVLLAFGRDDADDGCDRNIALDDVRVVGPKRSGAHLRAAAFVDDELYVGDYVGRVFRVPLP